MLTNAGMLAYSLLIGISSRYLGNAGPLVILGFFDILLILVTIGFKLCNLV